MDRRQSPANQGASTLSARLVSRDTRPAFVPEPPNPLPIVPLTALASSNSEGRISPMRFHIRWNGVRLPVSRARLQVSLMTLSVFVMAVAGSAGTKWCTR
jgi:hypothetical protein